MEVQSGEALALVGPSGSEWLRQKFVLTSSEPVGHSLPWTRVNIRYQVAPLTLAQARIVRCPHSQFTMTRSHLFFC